jgi:hypothetical protein
MGGGQPVEAIGTDALKVLVPDALGGLARSSLSAEKTGAMGLQVSQVRARYGEGERTISLEIADSGGAAGLMGLAGWAAVTVEREDDNGWEKTYKDGDRLVMEKWDNGSRYGEYNVVVGDRFVVKLEGNNVEMDDIKSALDDIDLDALAALKDEGVPKG